MSSSVPSVSNNVAKPSQSYVVIILTLTVCKNGPNRPVHSAGTTNNLQSLSFVKNAINVKVCGFALSVDPGFVVGPIMTF